MTTSVVLSVLMLRFIDAGDANADETPVCLKKAMPGNAGESSRGSKGKFSGILAAKEIKSAEEPKETSKEDSGRN